MFLAVMFHPMDSHCIHVDSKAPKLIKTAVGNIIKCYQHRFPSSNIFVPLQTIPIFWGHSSVLEADLICLRELHSRDKNWKMFINSAGSELPLLKLSYMRNLMKHHSDESFVDISWNKNFHRQWRRHFIYRWVLVHILKGRSFHIHFTIGQVLES